MAPIVHGMEQKYDGKIRVVYLDSDDPVNDVFKRELGYAGMPTYVLLDAEGNVTKLWAGPVSRTSFITAIDAVLAGAPVQ